MKDLLTAADEADLLDELTGLDKVIELVKTRHWYVVNTYSGHENRVKENLERRVETMGIEDALYQILVAEEEEIEIRKDKPVTKMRNLYPGYLFVEMVMTDEAWYVVRNTPGVTGFIGSSGGGAKPFPVSDEEIESILQRIGMTETKVVANFEVGDFVKILNGPFRGIEGTVESMNNEAAKADILTIMFGRETSTEVDYLDLQKID
ncbi:MAG: transcription termination/antitermination factor NusG [Erysipelothrix sp.]|nr:transcription termination/antitermination factor NusG [Erysipelothrix sp.]